MIEVREHKEVDNVNSEARDLVFVIPVDGTLK